MIVVPALIPVAFPDAPIVAMAVLLLLHTLPAGDELNVVDAPTHTANVPPIDDGRGLTVSSAIAPQPVDSTYEIVVVPDEMPVATPNELIVATVVANELHVPPPGALDKVTEPPSQMLNEPVIEEGVGLTVIVVVRKHPYTEE